MATSFAFGIELDEVKMRDGKGYQNALRQCEALQFIRNWSNPEASSKCKQWLFVGFETVHAFHAQRHCTICFRHRGCMDQKPFKQLMHRVWSKWNEVMLVGNIAWQVAGGMHSA